MTLLYIKIRNQTTTTYASTSRFWNYCTSKLEIKPQQATEKFSVKSYYCTSKLEIKPQLFADVSDFYADYCTSKLEIKPQQLPSK